MTNQFLNKLTLQKKIAIFEIIVKLQSRSTKDGVDRTRRHYDIIERVVSVREKKISRLRRLKMHK